MAVGAAICLNETYAMFMPAFNVEKESSEKVKGLVKGLVTGG